MGLLKTVVVGSAALSTGIVFYRAYKDFMLNDILVSVSEYVALSTADTQSFTDLSNCVEGEVRVVCNMTSTYKFLLKLNALFLEAGSAARGRTATSRHRSATASSESGDLIPLANVNVNEIVDTWTLDKKQQLLFSPACCSQQALLRYKARVHETFNTPVSARDVGVASIGPGTFQLSFSLLIHAAVLDLEVVIALPKKARVVSVNTGSIGSWHPSASSQREIIWQIGACGTGTAIRTDTASMATVASHVQTKQKKLFGARAVNDAADASPVKPLADETVVLPAGLLEYPQAELGQFMERIPFDLTYVVGDDNTTQLSAQRRSTRQAPREDSDFDSAQHVEPPAVSLAYAIAATVSGLSVRRLQVVEEQKNWDASKAPPFWKLLKLIVPTIDGTKLLKKAQYTTRFSQLLSVEEQY